MHSYSGPYYYFSALDLVNPSPSPEITERFSHRLITLKGKEEEGLPIRENPEWRGRPWHYNEYATFLALLTDFDADFLLSGLGEKVRLKLEKNVSQWSASVTEIIVKNCWDTETRTPKISWLFQVLPKSWHPSFDRFKDDICSTVNEALTDFCNNSRPVVRTAIETAQRLALAGFKPATIVVEDESSILRRWWFYARKRIRGSLLDIVNRQKSELSIDDVGNPTELMERSPGYACAPDGDKEAVEVLERLLTRGCPDGTDLEIFQELCKDDSIPWSDVVKELEADHPDINCRERVAKAVKFCREGRQSVGRTSSKKVLAELRELFSAG